MNLSTYKLNRARLALLNPVFRRRCARCLQPDFSCYCHWLKPFDPNLHFAILMHPIEQRRRIATGRMSHLSLPNSRLIVGNVMTENVSLNELLADPRYHCVMLYPGRFSRNLTAMPQSERAALAPAGRKLAVLVIDGTWATARKMVNQSLNLQKVPRIGFTPPSPSNFRVRRQPRPDCYSTIEAIHHTIELLGPACGFPTQDRRHDSLLETFDNMVTRQLELANSHPDVTMGPNAAYLSQIQITTV